MSDHVCGSTNTATGEPCQQPVAGPNETCWRQQIVDLALERSNGGEAA